MQHLNRWRLKDTNICHSCLIPETLIHAVYECPIARSAFRILENVLTSNCNHAISLSPEDIILGVSCTRSILASRPQLQAVDEIIVAIKQVLVLQRENKIFLNADDISAIIKNRINIFKYNNSKHKRCSSLVRKWSLLQV